MNKCLWKNLRLVNAEDFHIVKKKMKLMLLKKKILFSMNISSIFQLSLKIQTQRFQMRKDIKIKI